MNHCAARGCGRWTRAGEAYCQRHSDDGSDAGSVPATEGMSHAAFRARLEAGDYDALLGPGLREALRRAAAEAGLGTEIGALRVALGRLLQEERDPSRLASGVARVAGVSVQAARLRHGVEAEFGALRDTLQTVLTVIEAEKAAASEALKGGEER